MKNSTSGIYKIVINHKFYIGSAKNIDDRIYRHLWDLRNNHHCNQILQNAFNKYGENGFSYSVLEYTSPENLIEREQFYINTLNPKFNVCRVAGNTLGRLHSEETKKHLSEIRKGKKTSLGRVLSDETKMKIGEKAKLRGISENCLIASKKANTGRKRSQEEIHKCSLSQAKLTQCDVLEIKQLLEKGIKQSDVAKMYGVSQRVICRVNRGIGIYGTFRD